MTLKPSLQSFGLMARYLPIQGDARYVEIRQVGPMTAKWLLECQVIITFFESAIPSENGPYYIRGDIPRNTKKSFTGDPNVHGNRAIVEFPVKDLDCKTVMNHLHHRLKKYA